MEYTDYCSACLITDVKMHNSSTFVDHTLLQFLRFTLNSRKELKGNICFECAALLRIFEKFRRKCYRAQDVLSKLRENNYEITMKTIKNIDRKQHKLVSTISLSTLDCMAIESIQSDNSDIKHKNFTVCEMKPNNESVQNVTDLPDIHEIKYETKYLQESPSHDYDDQSNNFEMNHTPTENTQECIHNKHKRKTDKKEHRSKKRKSSTKIISESLCDDEPLANKISKTNEDSENHRVKNGRKNCNLKYFEDYATIVFLTPEDAKKELLLRKESSNYINSPFKCTFCYRGFEAEATFRNHMKKHSVENGKYECDICHLRFPEQRCLCKHRLASHKRKFSCKMCSYVCFCTYQAKTHMGLHKGKTYPCKECGEIFSMPNSLLMHLSLKHVTSCACACALCGRAFATRRGLGAHNHKVHRQDKNEKLGPKCEECGIHFATEEAWKLHRVLSSKHSVSNGCKYCGESFPGPEELKSHMRVHARKQPSRRDIPKLPASCTICNKYMSNLPEYTSHMVAAHPGAGLQAARAASFVCEICGLAFKKQCFLTYHQRKHSGAAPPRRAAPPPACPLCGRSFSFRSALNKHMKVHLNIRPHRCDICDKSFINPCDVRLHIRYVHNKEPWPKRNRTKKLQDTEPFVQRS